MMVVIKDKIFYDCVTLIVKLQIIIVGDKRSDQVQNLFKYLYSKNVCKIFRQIYLGCSQIKYKSSSMISH